MRVQTFVTDGQTNEWTGRIKTICVPPNVETEYTQDLFKGKAISCSKLRTVCVSARIWFFHWIQLESNMRIEAGTARESDLAPFLFMIQNSEKKTYLKKKYHWYNPRTSEYNILNIIMVNLYVPYRWKWSVDCCVVSYVLVVTLYRPVRLSSSINYIINHYICQFLFVLD